jgi:hypothetical protein
MVGPSVSSRPSPFQLVAQYYKDATGRELPKNNAHRVPLSADEAQKIQTKVATLAPAEQAHVVAAFDQYQSRFEWSDARKLTDVIGGVKQAGEQPKSTAKKRSVGDAFMKTLIEKKPTSAKELRDVIASTEGLPKNIRDLVLAALPEASAQGAFKPDHPDARRVMVKEIAKADQDGSVTQAGEAAKARRTTLGSMMAKAKCFEDLVGIFMFEMAKDMQQEVKEKMDTIRKQDPSMPSIAKMSTVVKAAQSLPKDTQAQIAQSLEGLIKSDGFQLNKDGPGMEPLKKWLADAKAGVGAKPATKDGAAAPAADGESPYSAAGLPPIDNDIARGMVDSDDPNLVVAGAVLEAQGIAKELEPLLKGGPEEFAKLSEDALLDARDKMLRFDQLTGFFAKQLPESIQADLKKPPAGDMVSRNSQFEELKMLMNEFSQVMQALSNILSTLDTLAMHSIRKIEAR